MLTDIALSPYHAPADFRAYVYDAIVLAWETKRVNIITSTFNKKTLEIHCGLYVLRLDKLSDVQWRDKGTWSKSEFLIFHNDGRGYVCLFKRLRDTFAHGHYWQRKRGWVTIRHRYQSSREKVENTRAFGNLKITTLKKLITFLDTATIAQEAA
ncbi:MAG: hypothetical protein HOO97_05450 [Sideroxydans sp.]|nr:hypothetical protein [Sideroxydans sp.]